MKPQDLKLSEIKLSEIKISTFWSKLGTQFLPFADAATKDLPLGRLLRLSLFQVTVGMATVLLVGTLNRVMIVEFGVSTTLVSIVVALPLIFAPLRALVGFRSDNHRSYLGWKRVPYIWMGTMSQFGGLAILPFSLLVLSGNTNGPIWVGDLTAALAFLLVGAGLQTTQTAGLALATDLSTEEARPNVVALMYVMLLVGMVTASFVFSIALRNFSELRLVQVIQGAAVATMVLNLIALWRQEARDPSRTRVDVARPSFFETWRTFSANRNAKRFLVTVALGTAAFNMQDIVLEPYGGEILHLAVGETSALTALLAAGALIAFAIAARALHHGVDACRLAAVGAIVGMPAFSAVALAAPMESAFLFRIGTLLIGFGGGLFAIGTLIAAMALEKAGRTGLALGAWGAAQATSAGIAIAGGGMLRDFITSLAEHGVLGPAVVGPSAGYSAVYQTELALLFITLIAIGPLVRRQSSAVRAPDPTIPKTYSMAQPSN
jgi:BCD family chlorophyll transporter-like MFS transporter